MKKKLVFKKVTKGTSEKKTHKTRPQLYSSILKEYEPMCKEDQIELMTELHKQETGKDVPNEMIYLVGKYLSLLCALGIVEIQKDKTIKYLIEE
jgi:hypothetical protein